eukprot:58733-Alexandrium_andersonii.AAC.1
MRKHLRPQGGTGRDAGLRGLWRASAEGSWQPFRVSRFQAGSPCHDLAVLRTRPSLEGPRELPPIQTCVI